jgi:hypothetical protein
VNQKARTRLRQPVPPIDALLAHAPQRQPEHTPLSLLTQQPHAAAARQVQDSEAAELSQPETGREGLGRAQEIAAMVPQGGGHGGLPAAEVVGVEHGGQTRSEELALQRLRP